MSDVRYGIDVLLASGRGLRGRRLGMVTNDAARTAEDAAVRTRIAFLDAGFNLVRLFSPEHGLAATAADGSPVVDAIDEATRLPIVSLYGERMRPPRDSLRDLDAVLFDIPDVGARFYTYIWTLSHVIDACAEAGLPLYVLDRPNPISGDLVLCEGPMLDVERCGSFLGRLDIPIRHGLTIGEFARLWRAERRPGAEVHVVQVSGWSRGDFWPSTGRPFVPRSPAMPGFASALLYPGICLFEATNLSLGRGTRQPFQQIGAPWLDAHGLLEEAGQFPGVRFVPVTFTPEESRFEEEVCRGIRIEIRDIRQVRPVALGLHLMNCVARVAGSKFTWQAYPTAANPSGSDHFERLIGRRGVREELMGGWMDASRIAALTGVGNWTDRVRGHLIYG